MIHIVLLSGGSGTRLWPLSNEARSKQFLKVLRDGEGKPQSMVQRTFEWIARIPASKDITIATSESQAASIEMQLPKSAYSLVLEPERRDTAPAIMLACTHLACKQGANADDTVVVMPIDTYADQIYYGKVVELDAAVQMGVADLVLLGVEPTYPSEKYGYIVPTSREGTIWSVKNFREKPDEKGAKELIKCGALWNCGVFAFRLGYLMEMLREYMGAETFESVHTHYVKLPKNSFDYEVVEKAASVAVVPYSGTWKDLGTWNTLTEEMADTAAGRVVLDETTCDNVHVVNETGLPMVVAGLADTVVVATHDGILACGKAASASIKPQVEAAAASRPMYERRRWGEYRVLDASVYPDGSKSITKELVVEAGRQLSYQRHLHRSEVWTVVSGDGEAVLDGDVRAVSSGSVVRVEPGRLHSVRAFGGLCIVEVQLGEVLEEGDIERVGWFWDE